MEEKLKGKRRRKREKEEQTMRDGEEEEEWGEGGNLRPLSMRDD